MPWLGSPGSNRQWDPNLIIAHHIQGHKYVENKGLCTCQGVLYPAGASLSGRGLGLTVGSFFRAFIHIAETPPALCQLWMTVANGTISGRREQTRGCQLCALAELLQASQPWSCGTGLTLGCWGRTGGCWGRSGAEEASCCLLVLLCSMLPAGARGPIQPSEITPAKEVFEGCQEQSHQLKQLGPTLALGKCPAPDSA